jgi:hypothetical protein
MISYFPVVTGSLSVSGSVNISGGITASGGISISGSIASASFASTASFVALAQSASNAVAAQTASFANTLTVAGNLTAQTLVVQTITSSVDFVTGSTRFGSTIGNTHQFTGSVSITGSLTGIGATFSGNITSNGNTLSLVNAGGSADLVLGRVNTSSGAAVNLNTNGVNKWFFGLRGLTNDNFYIYNQSAGLNNLILDAGNGTTTINAIDNTGNRTNPFNVLTIVADNNSNPYNGFGAGLVFKNMIYSGGPSIGGIQDAARIRTNINTNSESALGSDLIFDVTATQSGSLTPAMTLKYNGNVGIGTSSPQRKFVIADSSGNGLEISNSSGYSTLLPYNRTTSTYQNLVLGEGTSKVLIGTTSDNSFNFVASPSGHSFLGNTMQISAGDFGGTERQGAFGVSVWDNQSSAVINLASVFPRINFTSRALSVLVQIGTSNTTSSHCVGLILFSRALNGTWASSIISNINNGGTVINSVSGSGTSITLNFNNNNYGTAMITILNRA